MRKLTSTEIERVSGGNPSAEPIEEVTVVADAPQSSNPLPAGAVVGIGGSTGMEEYWNERGRESVQVTAALGGQVTCGKICGAIAAVASGIIYDLVEHPATGFPAGGLPGTHPE